MTNILNLKAVTHFVVVFFVAFAAQVAIGGVAIDLNSNAGRAAAGTAIFMAIWRALRITTPDPKV